MTLIYIIAGEASGDVLGARLIVALRKARPDLSFAGIGGMALSQLMGNTGTSGGLPFLHGQGARTQVGRPV